jgi:hypothetical protein
MLFTWVQLFSPKTYLLPNYQYLNHLFAQKKCGTSVKTVKITFPSPWPSPPLGVPLGERGKWNRFNMVAPGWSQRRRPQAREITRARYAPYITKMN